MRAILALCLMATAAPAQTLPQVAAGQYGSASDPATSCAANPHELGFIANPPHLVLTWEQPRQDGAAQRQVFDLEDMDDTSFSLRQERDYRPDPDGEGPYWQLQLTRNPDGYCWRREGWPVVRCEDQQLRCESPTS